MTNDSITPSRRGWHPALHLLWALPLSLITGYFLLFMSTLTWCGISGCSGGGFGRISEPNVAAAVSLLVGAGAVAALPLAIIQWSRKKSTRWLTAAILAVIVCGIGYVAIAP